MFHFLEGLFIQIIWNSLYMGDLSPLPPSFIFFHHLFIEIWTYIYKYLYNLMLHFIWLLKLFVLAIGSSRVLQMHLVYFCPISRTSYFSKKHWLILLENIIRNQDLSSGQLLGVGDYFFLLQKASLTFSLTVN